MIPDKIRNIMSAAWSHMISNVMYVSWLESVTTSEKDAQALHDNTVHAFRSRMIEEFRKEVKRHLSPESRGERLLFQILSGTPTDEIETEMKFVDHIDEFIEVHVDPLRPGI